jgi:NAD(P)-dependent dehydrogenase (short-subunit alcohol dehydrogenase family)
MRLKSIAQQVVVIMGASSGIGRATALRFAKRGAKLVVSARGAPGLASLVAAIRQGGGEAEAVPADAASFEQVQAVAARAIEAHGRLDTWVHLAAVSVYAPFEHTTPEEFRRVIDVNLLGQAHGAWAALPHLRREGRGALIHVSSVEARRALPWQSAYAASKHGVEGFLEALRLELQHEGVAISVTNVMPASINTPLFTRARSKLGVKPQGLGPLYQPGPVAEAILYAAEHPARDLVVSGAGQALLLLQRLSPALADTYLRLTGFTGQRTQVPRSAGTPDNLFHPLEGDERIEGDLRDRAHSTSLYTWFQTHPGTRRVLAGTVLGAITLLARRAFRRAA